MKSAPIITAVAAVVAVGMTMANVFTPEASRTAKEADRALRAGDARTLARLVVTSEWPAGDREAMVKEVLAVGHATSLAGCRLMGPSRIRQAFTGEWHVVSWWQAPNGQTFPLRLRIAQTSMGPRVVGLTREIVVHASSQRARTEGEAGMGFHVERLRQAGDRLSAFNLLGTSDTVVSDDGEQRTAFTPWSRYVLTAQRSATAHRAAPALLPNPASSNTIRSGGPWVPEVAVPPQETSQ